jgi:hypothetical protein
MLIGAAAGTWGGVIVGAIADMLARTHRLHRATLPALAVPAGAAAGALVGLTSDRIVSATIAGLIAGLVLGLLFTWIARPEGGST